MGLAQLLVQPTQTYPVGIRLVVSNSVLSLLPGNRIIFGYDYPFHKKTRAKICCMYMEILFAFRSLQVLVFTLCL